MAKLEFELIRRDENRAELGESPVWDPDADTVWWVDITGRKLLCLDIAARTARHWSTPELVGFVVLAARHRPAVGMQSGIFLFDPGEETYELLVPFDQAGHRFNDATVDRLGRLWTSTMALEALTGAAAIHKVSEHLSLEPVAEGLTIPNGLAADMERGRLYYSDSHVDRQSIWFMDIEASSARTGPAKPFATTSALKGRPDGAALDERGFYWIAGVDGGEVYVFDPDGQLAESVQVPFSAPTKLAFLGAGGRSVAITSKSIGEAGGYLALAELPDAFASGITQPYWNIGV